jgi:hypothetical protein
MNKLILFSKLSVWIVTLAMAALLTGCGGGGNTENGAGQSGQTAPGVGGGVGGLGHGPAPLNLGSSADYTILSVSALTNQPTSVVTGNVGMTKVRGSLIGLTCGEVSGQIVSIDRSSRSCGRTDPTGLNQGELDADDAYNDATTRAPDYSELAGGNIGGLNLGPAVYAWSTEVTITSNLTLTGGPNDVWIFRTSGGLSVDPGVKIILNGGALSQNIFWAPRATAQLGANSQFKGILLPAAPVFMESGASINGKLLAAEVHLIQNTVGP